VWGGVGGVREQGLKGEWACSTKLSLGFVMVRWEEEPGEERGPGNSRVGLTCKRVQGCTGDRKVSGRAETAIYW
jgi:hypothetical protein